MPQFPNAAAESGTEQHKWAADLVTGRCGENDVPPEYYVGVKTYAEHVLANGCPTPLVEYKLESIAIDEHGGTIDCLLIHGNKCAVYDYKSGRWPVDAVGNTQLLCYAAIAAEHFDVEEFFGVIVQPNALKGEKVKVAEYALDDIDAHRDRVAEAAVSNYKGIGDHCRFCPLRKAEMCDEGRAHAHGKGWK